MNITVRVDDAAVHSMLNQIVHRCDNMKPVFSDIGERMIKRVRDRFSSETDPMGNKWAPLSTAAVVGGYRSTSAGRKLGTKTKAGKIRAAFIKCQANKKILVRSGDLRDHIHYQATKDGVSWGTSGGESKYAAVHQFGGVKRPIPARPYLGRNTGNGTMDISPGDLNEAVKILEAWLEV